MKQIQDFFANKPYSISPRQTIRIVQGLEEDGLIKKSRIKGKRKQQGYTINEKNIETISDIWFNFPKSKHNKKAFRQYWGQYEIGSYLDLWTRRYRDSLVIKQSDSKKLKKMKEVWKEQFVWNQYHDMLKCVQQITNIEWALRTGLLGSGKGKRNLAERNISKLEALLEEMSTDLKEHDKKIWKQVLVSVYNTLEDYRGTTIDHQFSPNQNLPKTKF